MLIIKILTEYLRRVIRNYKIYTVSILGMGVAIIASFHIYHFVYKELSVDKFHEKREEVYRLVNNSKGSSLRYAHAPLPLGELLKEKLPEIKDFVRLVGSSPIEIAHNGGTQIEEFLYADPSFFEVFNFSLKQGSLSKFKDTPNGIVLSEKMAVNLFGKDNPVGQKITFNRYRSPEKKEAVVVGVMYNIPKTSTIQADFVVNMAINPLYEIDYYKENKWFIQESTLYVHAPKVSSQSNLSEKITTLINEHLQTKYKNFDILYYNYEVQRMDDIYLKSKDISQKMKGDIAFLKVLILVVILTLVLAASNYVVMNLGLNLNRAKEFITHRRLGASKNNIFFRLIAESILNAIICFLAALLTYPFAKQFFEHFVGFDYELSLIDDFLSVIVFFLVLLVMGIFIGTFEFFISKRLIFNKDQGTINPSASKSKKAMVTFQLFLFIGLLICMLFLKKQIDYIETKDLGFDIKNVISMSATGNTTTEELKNEVASKSFVNAVSRGQRLFRTTFKMWETTLEDPNHKIETLVITGDENYLKVHNIALLEGRNLNPLVRRDGYKEPGSDLVEVLVNEEFVKKANYKNPIGQVFSNDLVKKAVIIGVFKNVHSAPLYYPLQPIVLGHNFTGYLPSVIQISCDPSRKNELISELKEIVLNNGIDEVFVDYIIGVYDYQDIYKKELQLKRLLEAFTIIVLFISLLGLVAISLFITESKTKEIGIRKVNGATINQIMLMLNRDFIKWVAIAFVIACPIAYYVMHKWLENFAYKTELSWWVFALAGIFTLVIALLTVSWQTYRAATRNPVESLRTE